MRHYMTDPDNEERLLKIPPCVVAAIQDEAERRHLALIKMIGWGILQMRADALREAMEAVKAIPALYKVRGDFETYGPYAEGRADMKDAATSAIDALRENL